MAENINGLLQLLSQQILDMDLNFIDAKKIVKGDLKHMYNFLQLLMDVVLLIAQKQDEEEEEEDPKEALKKQLGGGSDKKKKKNEDDDETDTQKLAEDLGLDNKQSKKAPEQRIDVEEDAKILKQ